MPSQFPNPPDSFPDFGPGHGLRGAACQTQRSSSSPPPSSLHDAVCRTQLSYSNSPSSSTNSCYQESSTDQEDLENGLRSRNMTTFYNFLCQPSVEESLRRQELAFENSLQKHHSSQSSSPLHTLQIKPNTSRPFSFASSQSSDLFRDHRQEDYTLNSTTNRLAPRSSGQSRRNSVLAITPAEHPPLPETEISRGFFQDTQDHTLIAIQSPYAASIQQHESTYGQEELFYRYSSSLASSTEIRSRDITDLERSFLESLSSENAIFTQPERSRGRLECSSNPTAITRIEDPEPQLQLQMPRKEEKNSLLIEFTDVDDPEHPRNWKLGRKCMQTFFLTMLTFIVAFSSSVFSVVNAPIMKKFGVGQELSILGVSLFVLGFFVGPSIWGPSSELYGRKAPLLVGFFIFAVFQIPVAVAQNLQTILVCRFFGGVFGAAPLAIVGGALADIWDPVNRTVATCFFSGAIFVGALIGPIAGGFITKSYLGWRWAFWVTAIIAFSFFIIGLFFISESYAPLILQQRAKRLRHEKKQWGIHSELDEKEHTVREILHNYLLQPIKMFFYEPILSLITLYVGFIYGIFYLFFEAYPISFQEQRGYSDGVGSLPLLGIAVGVFIGCAIVTYFTKTRFRKTIRETGKVIPEERLPLMIIGAVIFPIGIFWFGWTSSPHITWVPQVIAGIPIGIGVLMIYLQGLNYIIDVYTKYTNSALVASTTIISLFGAGFPLLTRTMLHRFEISWACTLLGIIATVLVPISILFRKHGKKVRKWSRYANTAEEDYLENIDVAETSNV